jgi:hypothetical protein
MGKFGLAVVACLPATGGMKKSTQGIKGAKEYDGEELWIKNGAFATATGGGSRIIYARAVHCF